MDGCWFILSLFARHFWALISASSLTVMSQLLISAAEWGVPVRPWDNVRWLEWRKITLQLGCTVLTAAESMLLKITIQSLNVLTESSPGSRGRNNWKHPQCRLCSLWSWLWFCKYRSLSDISMWKVLCKVKCSADGNQWSRHLLVGLCVFAC